MGPILKIIYLVRDLKPQIITTTINDSFIHNKGKIENKQKVSKDRGKIFIKALDITIIII